MRTHTPGPWGWFRGYLVTVNADGSVPLNAKVIATSIAEVTPEDSILIAAAPTLADFVRGLASWGNQGPPSGWEVVQQARKLIATIDGGNE